MGSICSKILKNNKMNMNRWINIMCNQKKDLENLDIPTKPTSLQALQKHVKCDKCIHLQAIKCGTNQPPFFQNMIFKHVLMDYVVQMGPSFMSVLVTYVMCSHICWINNKSGHFSQKHGRSPKIKIATTYCYINQITFPLLWFETSLCG